MSSLASLFFKNKNGITRVVNNIILITLCFIILTTNQQKVNAAGQTWNFSYTGAAQTWTVPYTGKYQLEVWGAQGGGTYGGNGGYSKGEISLNKGEIIYLYVGQQGLYNGDSGGYKTTPGGWNGGGSAYCDSTAASGGGASDVRRNGTALTDRIIVAGGGGGQGQNNTSYPGGHGGGLTGADGTSNGSGGKGATQTSGGSINGALGQGGNGSTSVSSPDNGGGGGGYYGGGGGSADESAGAGGSSYIGGVQNGVTTAGINTGNGKAIITALNNQPSLIVSTPTVNQTFSSIVSIPLSGTANDPDVGQILKVYYRIDGSAGQAGTQVGSNITANGANQSYSCSINVGSLSEGNHILYTWVVDEQNASSSEITTAFTVKKTAPGGGGLSVNSGAQYAKSSPLTLTTTASGATKMFISLGSSTTPTSATGATSGVTTGWIQYRGTYNWNYTGADGNIIFYAWYSDDYWNISSSYSDGITFDKTAPTGGSIIINKKPDGTGMTYANTSPLNLTLNAADAISPSAVKMFISTSSTAPIPTSTAVTGVSTGWINYAAAYNWAYTGVDGTVKLNVWYMDAATNITPMYYDEIIFDKTPSAGTVTINAPSGGIYTHTATTQQELSAGTAQNIKSTTSGDLELDNSTSGTYVSQVLDLSGVTTAGGSLIGWTEYLPSGTDIRVDTSITFNRGATWTDWTRANKYEAISGINVGMDLRTVWLKYRVTLTSTTLGITPQFNDITVSVVNPGAGSAGGSNVILSFTKVYSYANVNEIIISNTSDFQLSQTYNYADTIDWVLDNSVNSAKTVYAKYTDWAGNTSSYFASSTVIDNTSPAGTISINGGAASTNQSNVTLTIGVSDDTTAQSEIQMMISNREDFTGGVWESFVQNKTWPIDSSTSGTKTVYVKFKDKLGNISEPVSASISYTAQTSGGSGGNTIINSYITYSFLTNVQQYQIIDIGGTKVYVTGPGITSQSLSDSERISLQSASTFYDKSRVSYRLEFDVTDENADKIQDMEVDFYFNSLNADGIVFEMSSAKLMKYTTNTFEPIKTLVPAPLPGSRNRFVVGLGNDITNTPVLTAQENRGGKYAIDYSATITAYKTPMVFSDDAVSVKNEAVIRIFTGAGGYTEFIEPRRPGKQFYIETLVSRWNSGVH